MFDPQVIIPNLNRRFSGITSTVARVIPHQAREWRIASVGFRLPCKVAHMGWRDILRITRTPLAGGRPRLFHARRNNEMLAGFVLKYVLRRKLHLIFTSTAQRRHTRWTRFLYRRMDTLLSTSPRAASYLLRKPDRIIPHGVDTEIYHPADDRQASWQEGGLPGTRGIGIFGRIRPQKGLAEFVSALCRVLPKHPGYTAVVIGEITPKYRPFAHSLQEQIQSSGLQDHFCWLGKLPFAEIPTWFRRMSLVACVPHNEGFGLTCLESMASGAPVVATRTGAFEMLIREGVDGMLVPCADTDALARALDAVLSDPLCLEEMGKAARERVCSAFRIEREATELNRIYREVLRSHPAPARFGCPTTWDVAPGPLHPRQSSLPAIHPD